MAAPASAFKYSFTFRDAKGQTAVVRMVLGGATISSVETAAEALNTLFGAMSNAKVTQGNRAVGFQGYGTAATYETVEDKAVLTFLDPNGSPHRFQIPAPKAADFKADAETVDAAETNTAAVIASISANAYGRATDTAPLVYVGGIRLRRRLKRKFNIFTFDPTLTLEGE